MATFTLTVQHNRASDYKGKESDSTRLVLQKAATFLNGLSAGAYQGTELEISQDAASATVTLSGVDGAAATGSYALSNVGGAQAAGSITFSGSAGAWTATINGIELSGSSAGDDDTEGDELASAIQGNVTLNALISASNDAGEVTIAANAKGTAGNAITLAVTGTGVTRSGATLTGGLNGAVTVGINGTSVGPVDTTNLTDTAAATAVAAAVELNGTLAPLVTCVGNTTNVSITWNVKGTVGNAVTLAAGVSTTGTATRSGATLSGGADNDVTVTVGGVAVVTDTTTLANTAAATAVAEEINADVDAAAIVNATASSNVVTITAVAAGDEGNGISLTSATDAGTATASAATLSGGTSFSYSL